MGHAAASPSWSSIGAFPGSRARRSYRARRRRRACPRRPCRCPGHSETRSPWLPDTPGRTIGGSNSGSRRASRSNNLDPDSQRRKSGSCRSWRSHRCQHRHRCQQRHRHPSRRGPQRRIRRPSRRDRRRPTHRYLRTPSLRGLPHHCPRRTRCSSRFSMPGPSKRTRAPQRPRAHLTYPMSARPSIPRPSEASKCHRQDRAAGRDRPGAQVRVLSLGVAFRRVDSGNSVSAGCGS